MPDGRPSVELQSGTWVLQADAAALAACSLSAIRKWRRSGAVAERMTTNAAGQERVEVRLEDVMARVGQQPGDPYRAVAPAEGGLPPTGAVIVALPDLEALFERAAEAERRVTEGEARLQVAEDEARFLLGRLAELRQQLDAERARPAPVAQQPPPPAPPPPPRAPRPAVPPPPPAEAPRPPAPPRARPPRIPTVRADPAALASELHRLYVELHSSRPAAGTSPGAIRRRRRTLAAYDAALLEACEALRIPGRPSAPAGPLDPERRTALSRALAAAGLDVRVPPPPARSPRQPARPLERAGGGRRG